MNAKKNFSSCFSLIILIISDVTKELGWHSEDYVIREINEKENLLDEYLMILNSTC